ncbi:zinc finger protein Xfin [Sergentomyia squamirostris]
MLGVEDEEEDLDDTHLCIKCNRTIIGLENYVKHRKDKTCNPNKATLTLNHVQNETPYTDRMGADTFSFNYPEDTPKAHETSADVKLPSENLEYHYDLGADFFFSSLELQSSAKRNPVKNSHDSRVLTRKTTATIISNHPEVHDDDWIPHQQDHESEKLMKAVCEIGDLKKDDPIFHKDEFPQESPESSSEEEDIDEFAPPRHHTGGKWKPSDPNNPERSPWGTRTLWDEPDDPEEPEDDFFSPPSNHTKGKWIPGSKITKLDYKSPIASSSKTPIWCHTCNKQLASQQIYERHLQTNLHKRKALPEIELAQSYAPQQSRMSHYAQQMFEQGVVSQEDILSPVKSSRMQNKTVKRLRRKVYSRCDVCRMKMRHHLMGKHLISHYHYRRMNLQPVKSLDAVLKNIHRIVLQSPFQCQPCRFYANSEDAFMAHWNSKSHQETVLDMNRLYCSFCKFECTDNAAMTLHLMGVDHQEVIWAINRSVPIIIREKVVIRCESCNTEFRYNIELRRHAVFCQPLTTQSSASDVYQSKFTCEFCSMVFKTRKALQRHERSRHDKIYYYCTICMENFESSQLARAHRQTLKHKLLSARAKGANLKKTCSVCSEILPDILQLKKHLAEKHPHKKYPCIHCGESFILWQELSSHRRNKTCGEVSRGKSWKNSDENMFENFGEDLINPPSYVNESEETYFSVHTEEDIEDETTQSQPILPRHSYEIIYKCDVCGSYFNNSTELRSHFDANHALAEGKQLKTTYKCKFCDQVFKKRFILEQHLHVHRDKMPCKRFVCPQEGCCFTGRSLGEVNTHIETHNTENRYQCLVENCTYQGKTLKHLKRHNTLKHGTRKEFKCPDCAYSTTSSSHLKRHQRIHTNDRPYKCPHCNYSARTSDSLAKHIKTKAHRSMKSNLDAENK